MQFIYNFFGNDPSSPSPPPHPAKINLLFFHSFYDHDLTNSDLTFRVRVTSQVISLNPMIRYRHKKTTSTQGVRTIKLTKIILTLRLKNRIIMIIIIIIGGT